MASYIRSWWYGSSNEDSSEERFTTAQASGRMPGGLEDIANEAQLPAITIEAPNIHVEGEGDLEYHANDKRRPEGRRNESVIIEPAEDSFSITSTLSTPDLESRNDTTTVNRGPKSILSLPSSRSTREEDEDMPPAFPSLNSIQRSRAAGEEDSSLNGIFKRSDVELMPPPSIVPVRAQPGMGSKTSDKQPVSSSLSALRLPTVSGPSLRPPAMSTSSVPHAASLRVPAFSSTTSSTPSSLMPPPTTTKPPPAPTRSKNKRTKVMLAPGHSPLDWAALKSSGQDLRGTTGLLRVMPSMLKEHNTVADAWTAINGRVYNITPYLDYHPGGVKELMRVAGRDGTKLFALTHAWVNAEFMLDACMVGFLVPEGSVKNDKDSDDD